MNLDNRTRLAIANEVKDFIIERTQDKHLDKNNQPFKPASGYSKSYKNSLDFRLGGKTNAIDLTLSGDMLAAMEVLENKKGKITIGYKKGTENDKAEGNIIGSYGKPSGDPKKARDFLGITDKDFKNIVDKYKNESAVEQSEFNRDLVDFIFGG